MANPSAFSTTDKTFSSYKYIEAIESRLKVNTVLNSQERTALLSNLAAAQFELGLYRKCIKSCQSALDLSPYHTRSCILKGKALYASGKEFEALSLWTEFLQGDTLFCDVLLIQELKDLILAHTNSPVEVRESSASKSNESISASALESCDDNHSPPPLPLTEGATADPQNAAGLDNTCLSVAIPATSPAKAKSPALESKAVPPPAAEDPKSSLVNAATAVTAITAQLDKTIISGGKSAGSSSGNGGKATSGNSSNNSSGRNSPVLPRPTTPKTKNNTSHNSSSKVGSTKDKATVRKALIEFHKKEIGNSVDKQIKPLLLRAMKSNLPHLSGEELMDDLIALGYINVNAGKHPLALTIFKLLLDYRSDLPSALIGLGSIHAMQRQLDLAESEFSDAISIDPKIADAWKRRGQTRAAKNDTKGALKDLTRAISLQSDADIYNQRGLVYNQAKNHLRALSDFRMAQSKGLNTAPLLNYIGMCEGQLGNVAVSIESHKAAVKLDPKLREAYLNMALMYKENGDWQESLDMFSAAINADLTRYFTQAYTYRAVMYYQLGSIVQCLKETSAAMAVMSHNITSGIESHNNPLQNEDLKQALIRSAICYQSLGQFKKSVECFDRALKIDPNCSCWFQREIALFLWNNLDTDLRIFNVDDRLDSRIKDGWCKHVQWREYMSRAQAQQYQGVGLTVQYVNQRVPTKIPPISVITDGGKDSKTAGGENSNNNSSSTGNDLASKIRHYEQKMKLITATKPFSTWIQLQTPGFLPNIRQHRMFGLAVLQMALALRRHIQLIQLEGVGLELSDTASSKLIIPLETYSASVSTTINSSSSSGSGSSSSSSSFGSSGKIKFSDLMSKINSLSEPSSGKRYVGDSKHALGWRDLFDIAVRWRQLSEPNDPVWWIDRFPQKAYTDGFGLQTPIVNGQMKTVRYYPYFSKAFSVLKNLLREGYYTASDKFEQIDSDKMTKFEAAKTLSDIAAVIQKDFYVVVPCPSLKTPGLVLEGTRLTLVTRDPDGFEFTIRTPGRPYRWSQYETELGASFQRLEDAFLSYDGTGTGTGGGGPGGRILSPAALARKACIKTGGGVAVTVVTATATACGDDTAISAGGAAAGSAAPLPPPVSVPGLAPPPVVPPPSASESATLMTPLIAKTKQIVQDQLILRQALELFYLWVTFAPLSRGTAACGYAAFMSVLLAHGKRLSQPLPQGKQLDWEAIFATDCAEFVDRVITWFPLEDCGLSDAMLEACDADYACCLGTLRDMLEILALPYDSNNDNDDKKSSSNVAGGGGGSSK